MCIGNYLLTASYIQSILLLSVFIVSQKQMVDFVELRANILYVYLFILVFWAELKWFTMFNLKCIYTYP